MGGEGMKLGLIFDGYEPFHEYKCPGQIVAGIHDAGGEAILFTLKKQSLEGYKPPFPLIQVTRWEDLRRFQDIPCFIVYTWISPKYNALIKLLKGMGAKVIVKADSDGRIGLSVKPKPNFHVLRFLVAPPWWKVPLRFFYPAQRKHDWLKVQQMRDVDALVVESPLAVSNVCAFLIHMGYADLIPKVFFIPNPVTPDIIEPPLPKKENLVVAVGRWDDWLPKNPGLLLETLGRCLPKMKGWKAIIIGQGKEKLEKRISRDLTQRVMFTGPIPHENVKDYLGRAKIFLSSSRFEGFSIAASEALALGCTLVGTPLESFSYLVRGGWSGSLATSFDAASLSGALFYESEAWNRNLRNPEEIAAFWRERLKRERVGMGYLQVVQEITGEK